MAGHEGIKVMQADGLMPATVRGVLGCAWGGIGVSYHFCTFSLTEGIPAICLYADPYYKQKAQGIAAFWGDERLSLSLSEMQVGPAMSHIRQVFEDTKLRAALVQRTQDAQRTWHEIFRRAVSGWSS
jgi:hypothetical protein